MKQHTQDFKNQIKEMGREFISMLTYTDENEEEVILTEELYSVSLNYEGALLKSVMKRLNIESSVDIPKNTIVDYKLGMQVNGLYEILDYGNFVVYESEKQEDSDTYSITCYDKILYSMKDYEEVELEYPVTVREYIEGLCNTIGISFANAGTSFANYDRTIYTDLYKDIGYTYRDVLDELAQVTASTICINANDELEIRYIPSSAVDTLDEQFLKDVNVNFGEKYGPINSIVLSRSGETDNVYLQDVQSVEANGLCELKIIDNQIMNNNDRSDYLEAILTRLDGLEYYISDFASTGILYYDVCDRYNVVVGDNTYSCVMFNDEINIEQGLEEIIYSERPEQTETDYTKADKTDRKINQTYLIVDKQNQIIESVVNNVTEQNNKISRITQTVDDISSQISDIADITITGENDYGLVTLANINQSEPIMIRVHPIVENISYLYPNTGLYPSATTYLKIRKLRFIRTYEEDGETKTENIDYELPDDLLWYSSSIYDEFYLDYESQTCQVIKRCEYNADGTVSATGTEVTTEYEYPEILLGDGDYQISLLGYDVGYLFVRLMAKNIYTDQFATRAEVRTQIQQTSQEILLEASGIYETKDNANSNYSSLRVGINGIQTQVTNNGRDISTLQQTATSLQSEVSTKVGDEEIISKINQSAEAITINANKISLVGKTIQLTSDDINIQSTYFNVTQDGTVTCVNMNATNASINGGDITLYGGTDDNPKFMIRKNTGSLSSSSNLRLTSMEIQLRASQDEIDSGNASQLRIGLTTNLLEFVAIGIDNTRGPFLRLTQGLFNNFYIDTEEKKCAYAAGTFVGKAFNTSSLEEYKKNISLFEENALDIVKNAEIYTYNYKVEEDDEHKHIGFVIGEKYKTPKQLIGETGDSIESYSMSSIMWKALQELIDKVEKMEEKYGRINN